MTAIPSSGEQHGILHWNFATANLRIIDRKLVLAAARTICKAFSNDPLICWLRPGARPWAEMDHASMTWQSRRVQEACVNGRVLGIWQSAEEDNRNLAAAKLSSAHKAAAVSSAVEIQPTAMDAIAIFHDPRIPVLRFLSTCLQRWWLWILTWIRPVTDSSSKPEVRISSRLHVRQTH